jgi:hypothetical protein
MHLNRSRLERLIPLAQLIAPQLLREHLLRALEALRHLFRRDRPRRVVGEAVHIPIVE